MTKLEDLRKFPLCYVATPYSKYPLGLEHAFRDAARLTGELLKRGLSVYSPIAHTHPIAKYADIDLLDHDIWLPFDAALMSKSDALIVARMDGWEESYGVGEEIKAFKAAGKPRFDIDPKTMELVV